MNKRKIWRENCERGNLQLEKLTKQCLNKSIWLMDQFSFGVLLESWYCGNASHPLIARDFQAAGSVIFSGESGKLEVGELYIRGRAPVCGFLSFCGSFGVLHRGSHERPLQAAAGPVSANERRPKMGIKSRSYRLARSYKNGASLASFLVWQEWEPIMFFAW